MKYIGISFLIITIGAGSLFAANEQKIYPLDSELYQVISYLYIGQGLALPSTAGPYSADELNKMLSRINPDTLDPVSKRFYQQIYDELNRDHKAVIFGFETALEAYLHSNTKDFIHESDWVFGYAERKPLLSITLETRLNNNIYGFSEFRLSPTKYTDYDEGTGELISSYFGSQIFGSNLFFLPPGKIMDLDMSFPFRAFGAFGGDGWSVQLGRDKLSWGPGTTGNFMLDDHLRYHNMGRFTSYTKNFKYSLVTSFFPHPKQYYPEKESDFNVAGVLDTRERWQGQILDGLYMFLGHRLEGRLFNDKVGLAISESIMYQSEENLLDLRILNPAMFYHNYYIRANANSLLAFELDYSPIPYLNIYGQFAVDEFAMIGEPAPGKDKNAHPSAFAYMLGAKTAMPMFNGFFSGGLEFVKTDPFLYLRYGKNDPQKLGEWGINYIAAIREYYAGGHMVYDEDFIGYPFGPDAIVLNANAAYKELGKWNLAANMFYMWHGTHDKWTLWDYVQPDGETGTPYVPSPTEQHYTENNSDANYAARDSVSRLFVFSLKGGYTILPGLETYAQMDVIHIVNPKNISSNAAISDLQFSIGFSYSL
ncbi:hypothetical protein MASR2M29_14000 [Spirochaetota bacterium]